MDMAPTIIMAGIITVMDTGMAIITGIGMVITMVTIMVMATIHTILTATTAIAITTHITDQDAHLQALAAAMLFLQEVWPIHTTELW